MSIFDKGFLTILGCSALLILVAFPLALRKVPRNVVYGFRTRTTMADDDIWFEANAHFGRGLIASSLFGTFVAYVIYVLQPFPPPCFFPSPSSFSWSLVLFQLSRRRVMFAHWGLPAD